MRVRLIGPPGNLSGIGASIRLTSVGNPGPAREVHAGSGFWSQDSAVQVMATVGVELADGQHLTAAITKDAAEDLDLTAGDSVTVIIKSTEVMVMRAQ